MPKLNELYQKLKNKIVFISIGRQDEENLIASVYEKYRKRYNLQFPVAFDSSAHNQLGIKACPVLLLIDPNGIVQASTYSLTSQDILAIMKGKQAELGKVADDYAYKYDPSIPFLIDGNGGEDTAYLFRSVLAAGSPEIRPHYGLRILPTQNSPGRFEAINIPLAELYKCAYFGHPVQIPGDSLYGKISNTPIISPEIREKFFPGNGSEFSNRYSYSLQVPAEKNTVEHIQEILQKDLSVYFGFDATIEKRIMPYWSLRASDSAKRKLKTKGEPTSFSAPQGESAGFSVKNFDKSAIAFQIWTFHQKEAPIIDETGIEGNIDFSIEAIFTDITSIQEALRKQGLTLSKKYKEMSVLVIKEKANSAR
jgi:hypothetical protein